MNAVEKITKLVAGRNKSDLSRKAGLPASAIDAIINKGRIPLAPNAVKLASVLGVSADWLFDDEQAWPPPSTPTPAMISDGVLFGDVLARAASLRTRIAEINEKAGQYIRSNEAQANLASAARNPGSPPADLIAFGKALQEFVACAPSLAAWNDFRDELTKIDWDGAVSNLRPVWRLVGQRYSGIPADDERQIAVKEAIRTGNIGLVSALFKEHAATTDK